MTGPKLGETSERDRSRVDSRTSSKMTTQLAFRIQLMPRADIANDATARLRDVDDLVDSLAIVRSASSHDGVFRSGSAGLRPSSPR